MISLLFSITPFIFILYYFRATSKTKYVSSDMKFGKVCYSCKEELEIEQDKYYENLLNGKEVYTLCTSCKRDSKLDEIINHSKLSKLNRFKLYLISDDYNKVSKILLGFLVVFVLGDVTLKVVFDIKGFGYFYNSFLVLYWVLMIYRHKAISVKK